MLTLHIVLSQNAISETQAATTAPKAAIVVAPFVFLLLIEEQLESSKQLRLTSSYCHFTLELKEPRRLSDEENRVWDSAALIVDARELTYVTTLAAPCLAMGSNLFSDAGLNLAANAILVVPKAVCGMVWIQVPEVPTGRLTSKGSKSASVVELPIELGRI